MGITVRDLTEIIEQRVFSERDRQILKRRWIDDISYDDLAEEFYLYVERLTKIVKQHKEALFNI
jgi:hypothetical protein